MERYYVDRIRISYCDDETYLSRLPLVRYLNRVKEVYFRQPITFLVGENGSGKSTLLEAIAVAAGYNGEGGSKNFLFSTKQTVSNLSRYLTISRSAHEKDGFFLRAESFYNVASQVEDLELNLDGYGGRAPHAQSHGESFFSLVQNRFRGDGLYLLDEPEAALSPARQMALLMELKRLTDCRSQLIIATHSPILLAYPGAVIYQLSEEGIQTVRYRDCEPYRLTKQFLDAPEHVLAYLFDPGTEGKR